VLPVIYTGSASWQLWWGGAQGGQLWCWTAAGLRLGKLLLTGTDGELVCGLLLSLEGLLLHLLLLLEGLLLHPILPSQLLNGGSQHYRARL